MIAQTRVRLTRTRALALAALLAAAAFLAGATECSYRGRPVGGNMPDQFTQGAIAGFGVDAGAATLLVGGVEYRTAGAAVTIDGANANEAELRPGQQVALRGRLASGGNPPRANAVQSDAALVGPVGARDPAAGTVTVLGTPVRLVAETSWGAGLDGAATTPLAVGDRVVVHGLSSATSELRATRVERAANNRALQVAGRLASLDGAARRYAVRGTTVDYSDATVDGTLAAGAYAFATGTTTNADGSLRATRVVVRAEAPAAANRDQGEIEGVVGPFRSATDFEVGSRVVRTTAQTTFANGAASDLVAGALVTVRGEFDGDARLVATRVEFARAADFRVVAPIEAFDVAANAFVAGGVRVATDVRTRWEDRTAFPSRTLRYAELRAGEWIEARGVEETAARTATALVVERRDPAAGLRVELQGVAANVANPALTLAGVPVTAANAQFQDAAGATLSATQFFGRVRGQRAVARGRFVGQTLVAETVQLKP